MKLCLRVTAGAVDLEFFSHQGAERHRECPPHRTDEAFAEVEHRVAFIIVTQGQVASGGRQPFAVNVQDVIHLTTMRVGHTGDIHHHVFIHNHLATINNVPVGVGVPLYMGQAGHIGWGLTPVYLDRHLGVLFRLCKAQCLRTGGRLVGLFCTQDVMGKCVLVVAVVHRSPVTSGAHIRKNSHVLVVNNEPGLIVVIVLSPVGGVLDDHRPTLIGIAEDSDTVIRVVIIARLPDRLRDAQPRIAVQEGTEAGPGLLVIDDGEHARIVVFPVAGVGKLIKVRVGHRVFHRDAVIECGLGVIRHQQLNGQVEHLPVVRLRHQAVVLMGVADHALKFEEALQGIMVIVQGPFKPQAAFEDPTPELVVQTPDGIDAGLQIAGIIQHRTGHGQRTVDPYFMVMQLLPAFADEKFGAGPE